MSKKILPVILALALVLSLGVTTAAADEARGEVSILYTNDVHCSADLNMTYQSVAAIKAAMEAQKKNVLLVDCGDAIQGKAMGTLSDGEYVVRLMNAVGYDLAIPGNHEFDFGADRLFELAELAEYPYLSANLTTLDGEPCLDTYAIAEVGGWTIGFVGVTTPETMTSTNPKNYQDADGNALYSFCQGNNGQDLYDAVQANVDAARADGADFVILMGHLGIELACSPWTSSEVIEHTTGIDVLLDAHSHTVMEAETVKNANGEPVILTSTGTELANIGVLTIAPDGTLSTALISTEGYTKTFADIQSELKAKTEEVVAHTDVDLCIKDPANGQRMVRQTETNLGDLTADALRYVSGAEIALINGGGVRADVPAGDITFGQILAVHPFNNSVAVVGATGQTILDALELSAASLPGEFGSFFQVSGLSFTIDTTIESTVVKDENNSFAGVDGERRIKDVMVNGEPLDPERVYTVASVNFILLNGGDGMSMFKDSEVIATGIALDNQVLATYVKNALGGSVGEEYADPYGQGRITIISAE